ncbi:hypothetical protein CaCOL14_009451 [Colletotrichum acutatum]|uniref:Ankyrin repeat protein n=1 Tax=Glomerella acutata TaxID=27357 RepID=A0AAD8XD18_GLOAC|nr:uncharacterized protein BDZ83DRAFT_631083 [Colletotrichum acutatum]KAK1720315.1 hypothetical protein BDZ83DRAFT_631083 [Colletotrichum acutatum]
MYETADIVSACGGLIVGDEMSRVVRISHYAAQEYFEAIAKTCFPNAHYKISGACAAYLIHFGLSDRLCWISMPYLDGVLNEKLSCDISGTPRELLAYAQDNWCKHVHQSDAVTLHENVQELLDHKSIAASLAGIGTCDEASLLHVVAALEIDIAVAQIVSGNKDVVHIKDVRGRTALYYATLHGCESTVRLLLENGASPEGQPGKWGQDGDRLPSSTPFVATMQNNDT